MKGADSLLLEQTYLSLGGGGAKTGSLGGNGVGCGKENDDVVVMGGMYEVDLLQKTMKPIYWTGEGEWSAGGCGK